MKEYSDCVIFSTNFGITRIKYSDVLFLSYTDVKLIYGTVVSNVPQNVIQLLKLKIHQGYPNDSY